MNIYTKQARQYLKLANREEFENAIYNANLTPTQEEIVRLHIEKDKTIVAISMKLCIAERSVKKELAISYLKVAKCIYEKSLCTFNALFGNFKGSA